MASPELPAGARTATHPDVVLSAGEAESMVLASGNTICKEPPVSTTFTVSLVLDDVELTNEHLDCIFEALPDAVPAAVGGVVTLTVPVDAPSAESAAFQLVEVVGSILPEATAIRLDQDLVSVPDIAERTGRSRESIRLLVEGKRGPGRFPFPVGTVGDGIRVWPWASVLGWFSGELGEDLGERAVPPEVAAVVDACLAARKQHLAHRSRLTWSAGTTPHPPRAEIANPKYSVRSDVAAFVA